MLRLAPLFLALILATPAWSQESDAEERGETAAERCESVPCPPAEGTALDTEESTESPQDAEESNTPALRNDAAASNSDSNEQPQSADTEDNATPEDLGGARDEDENTATDDVGSEPEEAATTEADTETNGTEYLAALARPFITSEEYQAARPELVAPSIQLIWQVERLTPEGAVTGDSVERRLILLPGAVQDLSGNNLRIYDFLADRRLDIDTASSQMANTSFFADIRRRLDTFLGLSQGGSLDDIPFGPNQTFDRFWLEAAMGIRRSPVRVTSLYEANTLTLSREGGLVLFSATYLAESDEPDGDDTPAQTGAPSSDESETADETTNDPSDADSNANGTETEEGSLASDEAGAPEDQPEVPQTSLADLGAPIDLEAGESVVFDPSSAASPIALNLGSTSVAFPESSAEQQAQAELMRRWMRHALPLHPDVIQPLRGAHDIPQQFEFFVVSPDSIDGRIERWTLIERSETDAQTLSLPEGLLPAVLTPSRVLASVLEAARLAVESEGLPLTDYAQIIETHREDGDLIGAYLTYQQAGLRFGQCDLARPGQFRPDCQALGGLVAAGLGNSEFEGVFEAVSAVGGDQSEQVIEALLSYTERQDLAGAAARTLVARELLHWAQRNPNAVPEDLDPFNLFVEAISIDPHAPEIYWYLGSGYLNIQNPLSAWVVFDAGRAVAGAALTPQLSQVTLFEQRLRTLAPDFFLPR